MGQSKQQRAAAKRLVDSGQKRDSRGEFVAKEQEILELLDSDFSDDETDSIDGDGDDWHSVVDEDEEQEEQLLPDEITEETMNDADTAELEKEVNEINLDLVKEKLKEFRARGDSDRTRRKRNTTAKQLKESAGQMNNSIKSYFAQARALEDVGSDVEDNLDDNDDHVGDIWVDSTRTEQEEMTMMVAALARLKKDGSADITKDKKRLKKSEAIDKFKYLQFISIKSFFRRRIEKGETAVEASRYVAETIWDKFSAYSYKMVCVRKWANHYLEHHEVKAYQFSKLPRTKTIITDEQVQIRLREHVRNIFPKIRRTPAQFMIDLNTDILRTIPNAPVKVSIKTATRWMKVLGFYPKRHGKNYYVDGHERPDVVADRNERYLPAMESYSARYLKVEI
eukprot:gene31683-39135_t